MFRTSLKRNRNDYLTTHKAFEETLDSSYISMGTQDDLSRTELPPIVAQPTVKIVPAAVQEDLESVPSTYFVPTCLTNAAATKYPTLAPNMAPLIVQTVPLPIEIQDFIEKKTDQSNPKLGSFDKLLWMHDKTDLAFWRQGNTTCQTIFHSTSQIQYVAMGSLQGVTSHNSQLMLIVAIATPNKISLYNYKQNFLDELNISITTSNEMVTWMEVRKQGIFYGGNEGNLKVIRLDSNKKWKLEDGSFLPFLKNPLFKQLFIWEAVESTKFSSNMKFAYCLLSYKYSDNWLSRRLFWQGGGDVQKEIRVYLLGKKIELLCSLKEMRIIETLQRNYSGLTNVPYERMRITNINIDQQNILNIALSGGYCVQLVKPISLEMTTVLHFLSVSGADMIYSPIQMSLCHDITVPVTSKFPQFLGGHATQSLGLNNLTIMSHPLRFVYVDKDRKNASNIEPTKSGSLNKEQHVIVESLKKRQYELDDDGQLVQLVSEQRDMGNILEDTVFSNRREWIYYSAKIIKKVSKLRLMDVTLGMIQIYYDVLMMEFSDPNSPKHQMYYYLGDFVDSHGVVNVCQCLLEIILNRSISYTVNQSIYQNTAMRFFKQPVQLPANIKFCLGPKTIENTVELRTFAEQLLGRLSRDVLTTANGNLQHTDIMWQVLLKYYHTLYGQIKDKPISFFRKNQKLSMQIKEKLEVFKRFLIKKYRQNRTVDYGHRLPEVRQQSQIEWLMRRQKETYIIVNALKFPVESTSTLIHYMTATIQKINLLLQLFTRLGVEGTQININDVLTRREGRYRLRNIILLQHSSGNYYFEQIQKVLPEVLTRSDVLFSIWQGRTESEQLKSDMKDVMVMADMEKLEKVFSLYKNQKGGYSRTIEMLLYRLSKLTMREYVENIEQLHAKGLIQEEIERAASEQEEYHRINTIRMITKVMSNLIFYTKTNKEQNYLTEVENCVKMCQQYIAKKKYTQRVENSSTEQLEWSINQLLDKYKMPILNNNTLAVGDKTKGAGLKSLLLSVGLHKQEVIN